MIMQQAQDLGRAAGLSSYQRSHQLYCDEEETTAAAVAAPMAALPSYKPTILQIHTQRATSPQRHQYSVDAFTPLGTLGRGNMGTVVLVVSKQFPSTPPFALKITHSLSSKKQRSHVEIDILSSLHHPFLQTLHAHFESGLHSLLLLDFCSGGDLNLLRHRQPEKRFSETAARFYAAEVLVALEYLHKLGIVYRDLKPENILLQETGHIMLTDFDLSLKIGAQRGAEDKTTARAPVSSAASAPLCSLRQQLAARDDPDFVQGKAQSLHCGGLRKGINRRREGALEGDLGFKGVQGKTRFCATIREGEGGCLSRRKKGAGQRAIRCLCGTRRDVEGCLSRSKQGAAEEVGCLSRRRKCHVGEKEARNERNATKRKLHSYTSRAVPSVASVKSKDAEERCVFLLGTDEYVAPEVLRGEEHDFSMDWWSFGVLLYEMIYGSTPFKGASSKETLCNILKKKPEFPGIKTPVKHLIAQLLVKDPATRLGADGAHDIKQHPFFHGLHWDSLPHICRPPFIPPPLCLSELEERYSAKLKAKRETQNEQKLPNTCKSWLDELVESMEAADNEHLSSQYSRSSSSAGFMSSSGDGAVRELRRDDDVDALFSSAEWSRELDGCLQPSS